MNIRATLILGITILAAYAVWLLSPQFNGSNYGLWSLFPAALTIVICFISRNVLLALILGIFAGGLVSGQLNILSEFLIPSLGSENYAQMLLVYLWALGALLGLWNLNGGARHFAESMAQRFVHSRRSAMVFTWLMGLMFHQGGTISTVLAGTTVKPITDQHGVAHEELAYLVDSTASPVATILPFNVWPVYIAGLISIESLSGLVATQADAVKLYFLAIPFNFYAFIAVSMTLLFALGKLPLMNSPMAKVAQRVAEDGSLDAPNAQPMVSAELTASEVPEHYQPASIDFLLPILTLLMFCAIPLAHGGSPMVFEGFAMAVVVGFILSIVRGISVKAAFDAMVTGIKGVTIGALVLGLAVTLATVSQKLGTASYVIETSAEFLASWPYILPSLLLFICMLIAFSIGSSWGTYAVMFPIALPLALAISPDQTFILLCFGAITGGAVFGDQCSPISDTTILSSLACGSDLMDHVNTQLPLAVFAATSAAILYLVISVIVL